MVIYVTIMSNSPRQGMCVEMMILSSSNLHNDWSITSYGMVLVKKTSILYQMLIEALTKLGKIVVNVIASTCLLL